MTERFHRFELAKREAIGQDISSYGLVCFVREVAGKDYTVDGAQWNLKMRKASSVPYRSESGKECA